MNPSASGRNLHLTQNTKSIAELQARFLDFETIKFSPYSKKGENDQLCHTNRKYEKVNRTSLNDLSSEELATDSNSSDESNENTVKYNHTQPLSLKRKVIEKFEKFILPTLTDRELNEYKKYDRNKITNIFSSIYEFYLQKMGEKQLEIWINDLQFPKFNNSEEALNYLTHSIRNPSDQCNLELTSNNNQNILKTAKQKLIATPMEKEMRSLSTSKEFKSTDLADSTFMKNHESASIINPILEDVNFNGIISEHITKEPFNLKSHKSAFKNEGEQLMVENIKRDSIFSSSTLVCNANKISYKSNEKKKLSSPQYYATESENSQSCDEYETQEELIMPHLYSDNKPRVWKSPGEKKYLQYFKPTSNPNRTDSEQEYATEYSIDINANDTLQQKELPHEKQSEKICLRSLKEIDIKLMENHKRKMYIEEIILKLQKDKMAMDLSTMQLQNERFLIVNSAFTSNSIDFKEYTSLKESNQTLHNVVFEKEYQNFLKSNTKSTRPIVNDKYKNRRKRCQREILLEDAANAFSCSQIKKSQNEDELCLVKDENVISSLTNTRRVSKRKTTSAYATNKINRISCDIDNTKTCQKKPIKYDKRRQSYGKKAQKVKSTCSDPISPSSKHIVSYCSEAHQQNEPFEGSIIKSLIVHIQVTKEFIVCASDDGHIYRISWKTKKLTSVIPCHKLAITGIKILEDALVYSVSQDGFMKTTVLENFESKPLAVNLQEPLQTLELKWGKAFIGSGWGNVFVYDIEENKLYERLLFSMDSSVIALRATRDGPHKVLIATSRESRINFHDATSGILLRAIYPPANLDISTVLLDNNVLYCGSSKNEIYTYDALNGSSRKVYLCGKGTTCLKVLEDQILLAACYDGFIYALDKTNGYQIGRFVGASTTILTMEVFDKKLVVSSKEGIAQIVMIPGYILALIK